jgi:hypothetical protein
MDGCSREQPVWCRSKMGALIFFFFLPKSETDYLERFKSIFSLVDEWGKYLRALSTDRDALL